MTPCFSHGNMVKGQSLMTSSLTELAAKLEARGYTRPVDMYSFCRCFPPDVISKFAFGQSTVLSACDDDFRTPILESFDAASKGTWYRAYFPHMRWLQDMMPIGIVARFNEELQRLKDFQDFGRNGIRNVRAGATNGTELAPMMSSVKDLPEEAIQGTAISFIGGGSDTAGYTLAFASWHVLRDANLHKRLLAELDPIFDAAAPEMPDLATLESAPVLNAVVNESLRCGPALPGRLPRVVPENAKAPLIVDGELVPAGTIVGLSASTMHRSPEIWGADAATFNPDRWLEGRAKFSNIAVFGKGGRDCIGRPLALAELHIGLAFLFHKYRYELQPGSDKWVSHDRFTALATEPFFVKMTPRASGEGGIIA
jgi:cytochrome P450